MIDYTDPDTIARQNIAPNAGCNIDGKFYDVRNLVHLASSQADRIEELIEESSRRLALARSEGVARVEQFERNEALTEQLTAARQDAKFAEDELEMQEQEACMMENDYIKLEKERDALEAKLAKALEALEDLVRDCEADYPPSHGAIKYFCRATLAEIKGENHD